MTGAPLPAGAPTRCCAPRTATSSAKTSCSVRADRATLAGTSAHPAKTSRRARTAASTPAGDCAPRTSALASSVGARNPSAIHAERPTVRHPGDGRRGAGALGPQPASALEHRGRERAHAHCPSIRAGRRHDARTSRYLPDDADASCATAHRRRTRRRRIVLIVTGGSSVGRGGSRAPAAPRSWASSSSTASAMRPAAPTGMGNDRRQAPSSCCRAIPVSCLCGLRLLRGPARCAGSASRSPRAWPYRSQRTGTLDAQDRERPGPRGLRARRVSTGDHGEAPHDAGCFDPLLHHGGRRFRDRASATTEGLALKVMRRSRSSSTTCCGRRALRRMARGRRRSTSRRGPRTSPTHLPSERGARTASRRARRSSVVDRRPRRTRPRCGTTGSQRLEALELHADGLSAHVP